jgi:hypothetical protein
LLEYEILEAALLRFVTQNIVFLETDITRVLAVLSLMELEAHQSFTELMSDWSRRQSCGELMTRKILRSSAETKNLQWLIELHRSLMNTLKRNGPRTEP